MRRVNIGKTLRAFVARRNALRIPIPKIRACGGWGRRSQVPEDRYIDHMCRACDDARRFFGWLAD